MRSLIWSVFLAVLLTTVAIISRPLLPVDETRYLSVAWEAHQTGDFLVSRLNGETYAHKPPLLFWLINAVWSVTGVVPVSARVIAPAAGLLCLPLTMMIARRLWPDSDVTIEAAPMILVSSMLWMIFSPLTMFDTLLTLCTLTALLGILRAADGNAVSGWLLTGIAMGLGVLAKGPVVLVHVLPAALSAPFWSDTIRRQSSRWYAWCAAAVFVAAAIGFSWALPAAAAGGDAYAAELLYGQTAGRMVNSFAHDQAFWWYLPLVPICLLPWMLFRPFWTGCRHVRMDSGLRFLLAWCCGSLAILSLVSGKQIHYLLPSLPAFALVISRIISCSPDNWSRIEVRMIVWGTVGLGLMPLLFNHIPYFSKIGLGGIVGDYFAVPLAACGLSLQFCVFRRRLATVTAIATSSVLVVSIVVGALSGTLWTGFDLKPMARFAAECKRPIAWFSDYEGQLNFLGAISRISEVRSEDQLYDWLHRHPDGAVIIRLSLSRNTWDEILPTLSETDRKSPNPVQNQGLSAFMEVRSEFPLARFKPEILYVQWIQRGLTRSVYVIARYRDLPTEKSARDAHVPSPEI